MLPLVEIPNLYGITPFLRRSFRRTLRAVSALYQWPEFQPSSDRSSSWFPLTQNLANRAIVRSTISADLETMIDFV